MALTVVDNGLLSTDAQYTGFKSKIINGGMVIDQRNAGASGTGSNNYTVDRWVYYGAVASKGTWQQNAGAVTPPTGYNYYLGFTSSSSYTVGASENFIFEQRIEGFNAADLAWGTANAKTITISFWVRSSLTGTFGGGLQNSAFDRNYPFSYTISVANTWEQKSVTIAGDTSGTWLTTTGVGIRVVFGLGVGSALSGTAGAWTSSFACSATGATSVVGTSGATFYITGVQLEKGSTATSFDYRPYGTELQLCQRYLPAFRYDTSSTVIPALTQFNATSSSRGFITFPVPTRAIVTGMTISSVSHFILLSYAGGSSVPNAFTMHQGGVSGAGIDVNFASAVSADKNTGVVAINNSAGYVYFTGAEL